MPKTRSHRAVNPSVNQDIQKAKKKNTKASSSRSNGNNIEPSLDDQNLPPKPSEPLPSPELLMDCRSREPSSSSITDLLRDYRSLSKPFHGRSNFPELPLDHRSTSESFSKLPSPKPSLPKPTLPMPTFPKLTIPKSPLSKPSLSTPPLAKLPLHKEVVNRRSRQNS